MSPRLEYAVSAGALAVTLGLLALHLFGFGMADAIVWQVGAAASAAALSSAFWVSAWRWLVNSRRHVWRLLGVVFFTVLVALGVFFPLSMIAVSVDTAAGLNLRDLAGAAAVLVAFAAMLGGVPALLFTVPLAWRFLRRRDRKMVV